MWRNIVRNKMGTVRQWVQDRHVVEQKVKMLANLITKSKYPILFTGAGCSTSLGIPDYRSHEGTVVSTGAGVWNRNSSYEKQKKPKVQNLVDEVTPSFTHMSIKTLLHSDIFKFLVSQNTDGLHLRSGVDMEKLAELHGNRNLEKCVDCKRQYFRDFRTLKPGFRTEQQKKDHRTGRKCQNCGGDLHDSIVYFGQKLPIKQLGKAYEQAAKSDLCLCIGSSLTVKPSVNVPLIAHASHAHLCIINLQQTPLDYRSSINIHGFCDEVMELLLKQLNVKADQYEMQHYLQLIPEEEGIIRIVGKDKNWNNFTFIKSISTNEQTYQGNSYQYVLPMSNQHEININFHGPKPSASISSIQMYKIYHGEKLRLKLTKAKTEKDWSIKQL